MSDPDTDRPKGQLFEEAATWFARMRGPDADASRDEFEAWLARGALHRSAYNRAAEIFAMGKLLQDQEAGDAPPADHAPRKRLPVAGAVAAACLIVAGGGIGIRQTAGTRKDSAVVAQHSVNGDQPVELTSQAREGAVYRLNDGSLVILAAASRLGVDITPQVRRLTLEAGEGRFNVAHEVRPFIVYAGGGSVTARGTIFDVALSSDRRVSVHLIEGVVDVAVPGPPPAHGGRRLLAGQSTSFSARRDASGSALQPGSPTIGTEMAGVKEYDGVSLKDLTDAASRHSATPIRISGSIGDRRVSGRFRIDDTQLLAERIAALFDLTVDRSNPSVILLKAH